MYEVVSTHSGAMSVANFVRTQPTYTGDVQSLQSTRKKVDGYEVVLPREGVGDMYSYYAYLLDHPHNCVRCRYTYSDLGTDPVYQR